MLYDLGLNLSSRYNGYVLRYGRSLRCPVYRQGKNDPIIEVVIPASFARLLANADSKHPKPSAAEVGFWINVRVRIRGVGAKGPATDTDHDSWADFA